MTQATADPLIFQSTDWGDLFQQLFNRISQAEQQFPVTIAGTSSDFPGGVTIGSGPGVYVGPTTTTPTGLGLSAGSFLSHGYIDVSWTNPDSTISYVTVLYALKNVTAGTYAPYKTQFAAGQGFRLNDVIPGQTYGVAIVAYNQIGVASGYVPALSGGSIVYSDIAVPRDSSTPASIPGSVQAITASNTIIVAWQAPSTFTVLDGGYYEVQLCSDSGYTHVIQDTFTQAQVATFSGIQASQVNFLTEAGATFTTADWAANTVSSSPTSTLVFGLTTPTPYSTSQVMSVTITSTGATAGATTIICDDFIYNLVPGTPITATVRVQPAATTGAASTRTFQAKLLCYDNNGTLLSPVITGSLTNEGPGVWHQSTWNGQIVPADTYFAQLQLTINGGAASEVHYVCAAMVTSNYGSAWIDPGNSADGPFANSYYVQVRAVSVGNVPGAWNGTSVLGGGVTGADILARSIAAQSIIADTITANEIAANTIVAGNIAANTITTNELQVTMQLITGQVIRSSNYVANTSGWLIDYLGNAHFMNADIRGSVISATISSSSITGGTISGALIESATSGNRVAIDTIPPSIYGVDSSSTPGLKFYAGGTGAGDATYPAYIGSNLSTGTYTSLEITAPGGTSGQYSQINVASTYISLFSIGTGNTITLQANGATLYVGSTASEVDIYANLFVDGAILAGPGDYVEGQAFYIKDNSTSRILNFNILYANFVGGNEGYAMYGLSYGGWVTVYGGPYTNISDRSAKSDIVPVSSSHVNALMQLKPRSYTMYTDSDLHHGFIADEVMDVLPHMVHPMPHFKIDEETGKSVQDTSREPAYGIVYDEFIPLLVAEVQTLRKQLDGLIKIEHDRTVRQNSLSQ